jgi:hypothetical protein
MRSVHMWACPCGTRHKAVCEWDSAERPPISSVVCNKCRRVVRVDGKLLQLFNETPEGSWVPIPATDQSEAGRSS